MSYQSGPFGPGYTAPGGPPAPPGGGGAGGGGPWGPPPGGFGGPGGFGPGGGGFGAPPGYPPPPPPKKSNTGLIIGIVIALVVAVPMCAAIVIGAVGTYAAKSSGDSGTEAPPIQPATPPAQPAQPAAPSGANGPIGAPAGYRAIRGIGFSYAVPVTWQDLNPADLGSPLIESAQRNPSSQGGFMTNVNIAGESFSGDGPAYGAANLIELKKVATINRQSLATSGTRSAWDIESYWPNAGGVAYITLQRYVTNGWKGYVITCSGGAAVFSTQRHACETVLSTFRVD